MRCISICSAESYNIDELARFLREEELEPKFYGDLVQVQIEVEDRQADIFIFPYGCVTIWGAEEEEAQTFLKALKPFEINSLDNAIEDHCSFIYGQETTIIEEEDQIILESDDVLIKLSFSHALSQSVKLIGFEKSVDHTIETSRYLPHELAQKGKISLTGTKLAQKMGELFAKRTSINLYSDILDTPEFFWKRPKYEPYYLMANSYMDIEARLDILNKRLNVIHELYEILSNELKHHHSSRLEIVIVILISIEIVIGLISLIF